MPTFSINERNEKILFKLPNSETYLLVNKQVVFITAFPSSQMNRAKFALAMSWIGKISNSIFRHL